MSLGLKDASEFTRWQLEMLQKDEIEKIEHVQKMKIEMEMSREAAIIAQDQSKQDKHNLATKVKNEVNKMLQEHDEKEQVRLEDNKAMIEQIQNQHQKAHQAVTDLQDEKRDIRDQVSKELQDAAKRLKDEQAHEL